MNRILALCAASAALTFAPAAMAMGDKEDQAIEEAVAIEAAGASPVRLVEWTGDFELMKTSRRMRVWRSHLAYRLTVDAQGNVTGCELTETFRLRRVSDRLCDVLSAHHTFEPAHDASGNPIEGSYSSRLSYMEIRERL